MAAYERDLADASSTAPDPAACVAGTRRCRRRAIGAINHDVGEGAAVGAVSGGATSAVKADEDKQDVVKRCMRGRGYKVLN